MSGSKGLGARAYAKVNLGLEVLGRRDDGYHELRTILQTIDFYDELRFELADEGIVLTTSSPSLTTGPDNLIVKAARSLVDRASGAGARIHLDKRIPEGMGLGGGSADAAVTLLALDRMWDLRTPSAELHRLAAAIGMDVPFFLYGGTAVAVSAGAELYPLSMQPDWPLVLILPDFSISTAAAYSRLRLTKKRADRTLQHFAWSGPSVRDTVSELVNHLEEATGEHSSAIEEYKKRLLDLGALSSMMSGSGAAVFGVFEDQIVADQAASSLTRSGIRAMATKMINRKGYNEMWLADGGLS